MAHVAPASDSGTIFFELERLELTDDARLGVRGRWYGVRGRRFMRPTLTLRTPAGPCRLLADLEHKPWAAVEGEPWLAAFAWDPAADQVSDLELSVAPDIAVRLPAPGAVEPGPLIRSSGEAVVLAKSEPEDTEAVSRRLAEAEHRNQLLREELGQLQEAQVQAVAATARRDAALAALEIAQRERSESLAALERTRREREEEVAAARAAREQAIQASDDARGETAAALSERGAAIRASERVRSERDSAIRAAERASLEREEAVHSAQQAAQERDEAVRALEQMRGERDEASLAAAQAVRERDDAVRASERTRNEAARVQAPALAPRSIAARRPHVRRRQGSHSTALWVGRAFVVIVLAAILLALALIVRVI